MLACSMELPLGENGSEPRKWKEVLLNLVIMWAMSILFVATFGLTRGLSALVGDRLLGQCISLAPRTGSDRKLPLRTWPTQICAGTFLTNLRILGFSSLFKLRRLWFLPLSEVFRACPTWFCRASSLLRLVVPFCKTSRFAFFPELFQSRSKFVTSSLSKFSRIFRSVSSRFRELLPLLHVLRQVFPSLPASGLPPPNLFTSCSERSRPVWAYSLLGALSIATP